MKPHVKSTLINKNMSIRKVMQVIQDAPHAPGNPPGHIALAVDKKDRLIGVVTDGDIRRALLGGLQLDDKIDLIINRKPITFSSDLTYSDILELSIDEIKKRSKKRLENIIIVDKQKRPYDIVTFFELWKKTEVKTKVISIIGLGYVGLTLALVLADSGFKIVGVDSLKSVVDRLRQKKSHIHETGINKLLKRQLNKNFFVQYKFDNNDSDVYIICVGTPVDKSGRTNDSYLKKALGYIANVIKKDDLIILRSTVSIGTCRNVVIPFLAKKTGLVPGEDFHVAFAPERTLEGDALNELRSLPQIVGGYNKQSTDMAIQLFNNLSESVVRVDSLEAAEMVKLLNNTYRDLTFSFANETALICDKFNLDSHKVITAANHGYTRSTIPLPSPGVGGYCLTKDPYILVDSAKQKHYIAGLPILSRRINDSMIDYVCAKVSDFIKDNKKSNPKIYIMGLAFKGHPETADMRHSTSLKIIDKLKRRYKNIYTYDPVIKKSDIANKGLKYMSTRQGFNKADCVLILNNHESYKNLDIYNLLATVKNPCLIYDTWHVLSSIITNPITGITYRGL